MRSKIIISIFFVVLIAVAAFFAIPYFTPQPKHQPEIALQEDVDLIVVNKALRTMQVYKQGKELKTYKIALGFSPIGHKVKEGDGKTPEGTYAIIAKNPKSRFYKSLKISYPSEEDKARARQLQVSPGGEILIHGLMKKLEKVGKSHALFDWTLGCVAVTNPEIDELFEHVQVGTQVVIKE